MTLALYIARRFAKTVLTVFAGFFVLLYLIDMIEQIRRFADADISLGAAAELAALNTPQAVYRILPMILILASIAVFLALARSSELVVIRAAGRSALRMLVAPLVTTLLIGALAGTVIGIAAGWYRGFGLIARPIIELLRPIPPLAWIPLAIIWFGLGEPSKFFIIFLGAFFPVVTSAYHGMRTVDPMLLRAGQTMGLSGVPLLLRVGVPAIAPDLATGVRIGWGLSFGVLVAAELIAADRGLGYMIINERNTGGSVGVIIVGILLIGFLNLVTDALIGAAIKRWIGRWHGP